MARPDQRKVRIEPNEKLVDAPKQMTSMSLPAPVHHRLDELVARASAMRSNRAEIVAMLIAQAPLSDEDLETAILRYRKMTAGQLSGTDEATVVQLHGPGRRKSS